MLEETITVNGREFNVELTHDDCMGPPWKEHDGHGDVSEWRQQDYAGNIPTSPGERVLWRDSRGWDALVYDWQGAIAKAKADGWGLCDDELRKLADKLGREPTAGEIRERAVQRDFDYLRRYCAGDWWFSVITVTDPISGFYECIGGVESDCDDYVNELAKELAEQIPEPEFCECCGQVTNAP